jgi:hypothetical protein
MSRSIVRSISAMGCALVLAASASGCGGGSTKAGSSGTTQDLAVVKYRADATAICHATNVKLHAYITSSGLTAGSSPAAQDKALAHVGQEYLDEAAQLQALTAPTSIATDVSTWLTDFRTAATQVKNNGRKLVAEKLSPFEQVDADASAREIPGCLSKAT